MSKKNGIYVKCFTCDSSIYKNQSSLRGHTKYYCSIKCRNFRQLKKCDFCKKEGLFERYRLKMSKNNFCSSLCYGKWRIENFAKHPELRERISKSLTGKKQPLDVVLKRVAKNTGKKRTPEQINRMKENMPRGERSYSWKGGISPLNYRLRRGGEMKRWREGVFKRDDWTCQECKNKGGSLHAHHIKQFSLILLENKVSSLEEALNCVELWNLNNGITLCVECHKKIPVYK